MIPEDISFKALGIPDRITEQFGEKFVPNPVFTRSLVPNHNPYSPIGSLIGTSGLYDRKRKISE